MAQQQPLVHQIKNTAGEVLFEQNYHARISEGELVRNAVKSRTNLSHAKLFGAKLSHANLDGAKLFGADLTNAKLSHTILVFADLTGADLTGADLTHTYLHGADLTDANILDAKSLVGADLTYAEGLPGELLALFGLLGEGEDWIVTQEIWDTVRASPKQGAA